MSAKSRKEVLEQARQRYGKRGREGRSRLLDEVCELCGYERKYAIKVLNGKRAIMGSDGRKRGGSQAIYGKAEREVIKAIWLAAEQPCGKRLKAALKVWLPHYEKRGGPLAESVKQKVLAISASSIDRLFGALPGEPGSASSLRDAPRDPFTQTDPGSHRTLGCERTRLYRGRHRRALRGEYGRRVLLEPDRDRCAYPVDGDPRSVQSRPV